MAQERQYQSTDRENIEKAWADNRAILYQLPTGGGKSIVLTGIINDNREERQIIFAHKRRLITQMEQHLKNLGITPGILQGARKENLGSKVVIASIRTAVKDRNLEMLLQTKWDRLYIDEARHSRTGSYDKVLQSFVEVLPDHKLLGVDATPYRKDKKRLDKWFQAMVVSCEDVKSLQEKKFLAKVRTYSTPVDDIKEQVKEVAGDYQKEELSKFMRKPKYLNYVVNNYVKRGESRQALCFAVDKVHAKDLAETFIANGFTKEQIRTVSSDNTEEEVDEIFKAFESKKIQVLINIEMITEGVDLPEVACIIGARPTKSLTLYLQIVGRGTRPKEDGGDCVVLDCCGWTDAFGTVDSPKHWSLNPEIDPNNPRKKNRIVGKKEDGTFTDEPGEFDELVEMTPEEYMRNLSGGIEKAEKHNLSIDEQVREVQLRMNDLFSKIPDAKYRSDFDTISFMNEFSFTMTVTWFLKKLRKGKRNDANDDIMEERNEQPFDTYRTPYVKIEIGQSRPLYGQFQAYYSDFDKPSEGLNSYTKTVMLHGNLTENLLDSKGTTKQVFEMYEEILDLKKGKINIKEIQEVQKKFQEEEWQKKVNLNVKKGEWLDLPHQLPENDFFKVDRYSSTYIRGIKVFGEQINGHHNKILIKQYKRMYDYTTRGNKDTVVEIEKNYVKGERIWEMLKAGKYEPIKSEDNEKVLA